jgi:hypothetical protein
MKIQKGNIFRNKNSKRSLVATLIEDGTVIEGVDEELRLWQIGKGAEIEKLTPATVSIKVSTASGKEFSSVSVLKEYVDNGRLDVLAKAVQRLFNEDYLRRARDTRDSSLVNISIIEEKEKWEVVN